MGTKKKNEDQQQNIADHKIVGLEEKIAELENKLAGCDNQLKRAIADYRNLETRVKEGRSELTAWGTLDLITRFLAVLDYLEQATSGVSDAEKQSGWFKGVEMAIKQFKEVLKGEGLEEITVNDKFDPKLHEAVDTQEGENDVILKIVRKGYNLQGRVIRPTQVVVGREQEKKNEGMSDESEEGEMSS